MTSETIIGPDQQGLALGEAYARRELLSFLVWRDIKIRYKQTVLGVVWAVLVPVLDMPTLLTSMVSPLVFLLLGTMYFRKTERRFADIA
jgi:ABC-type polysaccharide/polyol phosphate export permease